MLSVSFDLKQLLSLLPLTVFLILNRFQESKLAFSQGTWAALTWIHLTLT